MHLCPIMDVIERECCDAILKNDGQSLTDITQSLSTLDRRAVLLKSSLDTQQLEPIQAIETVDGKSYQKRNDRKLVRGIHDDIKPEHRRDVPTVGGKCNRTPPPMARECEDTETWSGSTLLHIAARYAIAEIRTSILTHVQTEHILDFLKIQDASGCTPLHQSMLKNNCDETSLAIVRFLQQNYTSRTSGTLSISLVVW